MKFLFGESRLNSFVLVLNKFSLFFKVSKNLGERQRAVKSLLEESALHFFVVVVYRFNEGTNQMDSRFTDDRRQ